MPKDHLAFASINYVSSLLRTGRLSPVALVEHCLTRIDAIGSDLNAFITVADDWARAQAREAEGELRSGHWRGPLHGVPVAVKDFYDTAGIRTTAGNEAFADRIPTRDADMVARLRHAGAVVVGKTNMHKLGMGTTSLDSDFGAVVNPWSARHVAGGSSGGSAVAVATGLCFATIDTDAIGSGRLPAAICGVTCFKPTSGLLSTVGVLAGEQADPALVMLSHPCVIARSAADARIVFEALQDGQSANGQLPRRVDRLGIVANFAADDQVRSAFAQTRVALAKLTVAVREITVPFEAASFDISRIEADRAAVNATLFNHVDAIVLPTLTARAPAIEDARAHGPLAVAPDNTFFCNYFGLPAASVPSGRDSSGLPLAAQFVGPRGSDRTVLAIAEAFQRETGWQYRAPPRAN